MHRGYSTAVCLSRSEALGLNRPVRLRSVFVLFFAIFYGAVLAQIPNETFKDFSNYLSYAEFSRERLVALFDLNIIVALVNEPVWLVINTGLGLVFPPETVVRIIIFFSAALVAWFLLIRSSPRNIFWLLVFLLLPFVIKNHLVHLRQGFAVALFLWGWFTPNRCGRLLLMTTTPLVHASFFFVLLLFWTAKGLRSLRLGPAIRTLAFVVMGLTVGLGLAWLTNFIGARQANEYKFVAANVSGLGFVFWAGIFVIFFLEGRRFLRAHAFESGMILFYVSTYWLIEVTARILESGTLLILIAGLALTGWRRQMFVAVVVVFGSLLWLMRIGQPGLGFLEG